MSQSSIAQTALTDRTLQIDLASQHSGQLRKRPTMRRAIGSLFALIALSFCWLVFLDPAAANWGLGPARYVVVGLMGLATLLFILDGAGRAIFSVRSLWFALALLLFEAIGSLYWILIAGGDLNQSYLGRAVNGTVILAGVAIGSDRAALDWISRNFLRIAVIISAEITLLLTAHTLRIFAPDLKQVYHLEALFAAAIFAFLIVRSRSLLLASLFPLLYVFNGFFSGKSSFYLLAILFVSLYFSSWLLSKLGAATQRLTRRGKILLAMLLAPFLLIPALLSLSLIAAVIAERATRYENDVRRIAFELRWEEFLSSPIFGKLFATSSDVAQFVHLKFSLPSHNDLLDILAAGGIIAFIGYITPLLAALFGRKGRSILRSQGSELRYRDIFWFVLIFYALSAIGNPFLADSINATTIWFSIGVLLAANENFGASEQA